MSQVGFALYTHSNSMPELLSYVEELKGENDEKEGGDGVAEEKK